MNKSQIRAKAHNQARKYMTTMGRPSRWSNMSEQDKNLFLFVRGVNTETLTVLNKR